MKQNNRQLPDSKLLSLFSTWQQWHQTASVQLTAVAPALMNNLRLASLLCLAGTSGDTCPVWGGTGALCPRHTWQWRDKSVTCPSVIRSPSPVWSLGSRQPVTHHLCWEYQDSMTHAHMHWNWNPSSIVQNNFARQAKQRQATVFKTFLKT